MTIVWQSLTNADGRRRKVAWDPLEKVWKQISRLCYSVCASLCVSPLRTELMLDLYAPTPAPAATTSISIINTTSTTSINSTMDIITSKMQVLILQVSASKICMCVYVCVCAFLCLCKQEHLLGPWSQTKPASEKAQIFVQRSTVVLSSKD